VGAKPTFTAFFSEGTGALDDHFESWFLSFDNPPSTPPEGLESVVGLAPGAPSSSWPVSSNVIGGLSQTS